MSTTLSKRDFWTGLPDIEQGWDFTHAEDITEFTVTAINSGTNTNVATVGNGVQRLSGAATTDDSGSQMQLEGAAIDLAAGNVVSLQGRYLWSSDSVEWLFGLAKIDTSLVASAPTDAITLYKAPGGTALVLQVIRDSSKVEIALGDVASYGTTYQAWGLQVCVGANPLTAKITVYKDGEIVYQGDQDVFFNIPADEILAPSLAMQSGSSTGTQSLDLDFLRVKATRN